MHRPTHLMYHGGPFYLPCSVSNLRISVMTDQTLAAGSCGGFEARFRFSGGRSGPCVERFEVDRDFI